MSRIIFNNQKEEENTFLQKRQFEDYSLAEQYVQALKVRGFKTAFIKPELGKIYVYYKRF